MAKRNKCRPSTFLDIADPYTAYCFDEACAYIIQKIEDGEEPKFEKPKQHFSSFKDMYRHFTGR